MLLLLLLFYQYIGNEMLLDRGLHGFLVTSNPVSGKILKSYDAPKSSFFLTNRFYVCFNQNTCQEYTGGRLA